MLLLYVPLGFVIYIYIERERDLRISVDGGVQRHGCARAVEVYSRECIRW